MTLKPRIADINDGEENEEGGTDNGDLFSLRCKAFGSCMTIVESLNPGSRMWQVLDLSTLLRARFLSHTTCVRLEGTCL